MDENVNQTQANIASTTSGKWLERGVLVAIFLACAVSITPNAADPDLWGHVQYGRDALAEGIAATTSYSYTAEGYRWINHENLAEILLALGADTVGPIGLLMVKCLLGVAVLGLILRRAFQEGAGMVTACAVVLLTGVNLSYHWSMRPQLLTYTYYALMLALLTWCFQGWQGQWRLPLFERSEGDDLRTALPYSSLRMRGLWLAPLLFFIWANSHGGFVAGYCLFSAYLVFRSIEVIVLRGRAAIGLVKRFAMMIAASGLVTLINPYGFRLHVWLLESLRTPRPEIAEWHPPNLAISLSVPLWIIIAVWVLVLMFSRRSRDFTHLAILAITLWQSLEHQRHIPFFAMAFGFWMPGHVESVLRRFQIVKEKTTGCDEISRPAALALGAGLCLAFALLGGKLYQRLSDMPVPRGAFPVAAMQYIADQEINGKMVVTYNWAQYAIAAFGPKHHGEKGILVGFDGRFRTCYPQEVVDMHFDFVLGGEPPEIRSRSPQSPPFNGGLVLEYGKPDLALISRGQPHSEKVMYQNTDRWVLLYQDRISQLWGRSSKYDDPQILTYIPPTSRDITNEIPTGEVTWPAMPVRSPRGSQIAAR